MESCAETLMRGFPTGYPFSFRPLMRTRTPFRYFGPNQRAHRSACRGSAILASQTATGLPSRPASPKTPSPWLCQPIHAALHSMAGSNVEGMSGFGEAPLWNARTLQTTGEVRRDEGKRSIFAALRGVGQPRHPVRLRCVASGLPIMPKRRRFGLEDRAIRRMPA
jgi:hypothetical protein